MGADEAANALSAVFETLTSPYSGWHSKVKEMVLASMTLFSLPVICIDTSRDNSLSTKQVAALPFLQVLVFRNVFQLPAKLLREDLATCLTQLLADTQVCCLNVWCGGAELEKRMCSDIVGLPLFQLEVRLLASTSLGGLLRFFPESKVEKLKAE